MSGGPSKKSKDVKDHVPGTLSSTSSPADFSAPDLRRRPVSLPCASSSTGADKEAWGQQQQHPITDRDDSNEPFCQDTEEWPEPDMDKPVHVDGASTSGDDRCAALRTPSQIITFAQAPVDSEEANAGGGEGGKEVGSGGSSTAEMVSSLPPAVSAKEKSAAVQPSASMELELKSDTKTMAGDLNALAEEISVKDHVSGLPSSTSSPADFSAPDLRRRPASLPCASSATGADKEAWGQQQQHPVRQDDDLGMKQTLPECAVHHAMQARDKAKTQTPPAVRVYTSSSAVVTHGEAKLDGMLVKLSAPATAVAADTCLATACSLAPPAALATSAKDINETETQQLAVDLGTPTAVAPPEQEAPNWDDSSNDSFCKGAEEWLYAEIDKVAKTLPDHSCTTGPAGQSSVPSGASSRAQHLKPVAMDNPLATQSSPAGQGSDQNCDILAAKEDDSDELMQRHHVAVVGVASDATSSGRKRKWETCSRCKSVVRCRFAHLMECTNFRGARRDLGHKSAGLGAASSDSHQKEASTRAASANPQPATLRRVTFREYATEIPFTPWPSSDDAEEEEQEMLDADMTAHESPSDTDSGQAVFDFSEEAEEVHSDCDFELDPGVLGKRKRDEEKDTQDVEDKMENQEIIDEKIEEEEGKKIEKDAKMEKNEEIEEHGKAVEEEKMEEEMSLAGNAPGMVMDANDGNTQACAHVISAAEDAGNLSEGGCQNEIAGGSSNVGAMHASLQQLATPAADAQERAALALSCGGKDPAPKVLCPAVHGMEAATLEDKDEDQDAMKRELAGMKEDKAEVPGLDLDGGHDKQEEEEQMQKLGEPPHDAQAIGEGHRISDPAQLLTVCNDEKMLDDAATGESRKLLHASEPDGQDHVAHMPQLAGKNASQCSSEGSSRSDDRAASVSVMSAQAEAVPQEEAMALETGNDSPAEQYPAENEARAIGDTNIMYDLMY